MRWDAGGYVFLKAQYLELSDLGNTVRTLLKDFLKAAKSGNLSTLEKILASNQVGIDCQDSWSRTAAFMAAIKNRTETLEFLINQGAGLHIAGKLMLDDRTGEKYTLSVNPLLAAAYKGNTECVELILQNYFEEKISFKEAPGEILYQAMVFAITGNRAKTLERMLAMGISVDIPDGDLLAFSRSNKVTPLLTAARNPKALECLKVLVNNGAYLAATDNRGYSALHWVATEGNVEAVEILLKAGASVHAKDRHGETPLELLHPLGNRCAECARLLLDYGAASLEHHSESDLYLANLLATTQTFHRSEERDSPYGLDEPDPLTRVFVEAGAKISSKSLKMAAQYNHAANLTFLFERGGDPQDLEANLKSYSPRIQAIVESFLLQQQANQGIDDSPNITESTLSVL